MTSKKPVGRDGLPHRPLVRSELGRQELHILSPPQILIGGPILKLEPSAFFKRAKRLRIGNRLSQKCKVSLAIKRLLDCFRQNVSGITLNHLAN